MDIMKQSKGNRSFYTYEILKKTSLAIGRIFGGFPQSYFEAYHEHQPKTEPVYEYALRGDLYELFHYLNHTLLFGVLDFSS